MAPAGIGDRVEGFHAVAAAVAAGRVMKVSVESSRLRGDDYATLIERARSAGASVEVVADVRPLAETSAPQGIVAAARPIPPLTLQQAAARTTPAAVLVLDHFEDPRNVGAAARSALAAGITAMVVPTRRAAPISGTAFKAAAGALEHVAVIEVSSTAKAVEQLKRLGLWIVGLDGSAERSLFGQELLAEDVALVVGAEGSGLSRLVAARCDILVRIPMVGATESLNASVATALAVFEVARSRGWV